MSGQRTISRPRIAWLCALSLVVVAVGTVLLHVDPLVRRFTRLTLERELAALLLGEVHIDRIRELSLGRVVAEGVTVLDPQKRPVLRAKRLELGIDLTALPGGIRFSHGLLEDARIRAYVSDRAAVTLFEAFLPRDSGEPNAPGEPFGVAFDHVHIQRAEVVGDVPGLSNVHGQGLELRAHIRTKSALDVRVTQVRGRLIKPFEKPVDIHRGAVTVNTGPFRVAASARVSHGEDHLRANVRYRAPEQGPDAVDLVLALEPVSPELVREVGLSLPETMYGTFRGFVHLAGPLDALRFAAAVESAGGSIVIAGELPRNGPTRVHVESARLSLPEVLAYAPPVTLRVAVSVVAPPGQAMTITGRAAWVEVFGFEATDASLTGSYLDGRFEIRRSTVHYAGGQFDVRGWVDADADFSLYVRSALPNTTRDPTLRSMGLSSAVRTDLLVSQRGDELSAEGTLTLEHFAFQGYGSRRIALQGRASVNGDYAKPAVRLKVEAQDVSIPGLMLGALSFQVRGRGGRYATDLTARDSLGRAATAHVDITDLPRGWHLVANPLELSVAGRDPWRALADVVLDPDGIELRKVQLVNGAQRLEMEGRFAYSRAYRVDARLQSFDLGGLRQLSGLDLVDLDGTVDGELSLTGVPGNPRIDAQGSLHQGQFLGMTNLTVQLSLVFADGRFDIDSELVLPDGSSLAFYAGGEPGPGRTWGAQLSAGTYQYGLDFQNVPFAVSRPWLMWLGLEPPAGTISATLRGAGSLTAPELELSSRVNNLAFGDMPPLDLDVSLRHDGTKLELGRLQVDDTHGEIVTLRGTLTATLDELFDVPALRGSLDTRTFALHVHAPSRRLDDWPEPIRQKVPAFASGDLRLEQSPQGPTLEVLARLGWPKGSEGVDACGLIRHPEINVVLAAQGRRATVEATGHLGDEVLAWGKGEAVLPLADWLTGAAQPSQVPTSLNVRVNFPSTEEVPFLCERMSGPLRGQLAADDIFRKPPDLRFSLDSSSLSLAPHESQRQRLGAMRNTRALGRAFALHATGGVEQNRLSFVAHVDQGGASRLSVFGAVPSAAFGPAATRGDVQPIEARISVSRFELAPVLLALPLGARATGRLDGDVRVAYDLDDAHLELDGALALSEGRLVIAALGQELTEVSASLRMRDNTLRIANLKARDFEGELAADGEIVFDHTQRARARLVLRVNGFPLRREGAVVSTLTGKMPLRAEITPERTRAELSMAGLRIDLPSDFDTDIQGLDPHPDIAVKGEEKPPPPENPHLFEMRVVAKPAFRVRRTDLTADVAVDLTARYRAPVLTMQGSAELERGSFELYGKRFELEESRMAFDGGDSLDPLVSLYALHKIGSDEIGVRVEGRLSAPTVTFTHSNPAITDTGEIIAELLGARRDDTSSSDQDATFAAANFLAGATAGLLTEEVRKEFGGALPVLAIESGDQAFRNARIRAGVQLDRFVEKRLGPLRHVVRGAYVEGFVAPGADPDAIDQNAAPQSRGGGLLELRFPRDFVGSVEYRPVQNWRLDVAWEP